MTLILPLLISNGSWGSDLPECEGSPLDIASSEGVDAMADLVMLSFWNDCQGEVFLDGGRFFGRFRDGVIHGQGTATYTDGAQYVGEWEDGYMRGQGTYTWANGAQYVGKWKDGLRHGQGTYTWTDGSKKEGIWKDDKFLYENIAITNEDEEFCQEIGFTINTPEYDNCVQKSAEKD